MTRRALPPPWMLDRRDWAVRRSLALLRMRVALERLKTKEDQNG